MKPLLKWAGGKRQIAKKLKSFFPDNWNEGKYIEPFIGGAAMFLFLNPNQSIIADINKRLYGFYLHVQNNSNLVFEGILDIAKKFDESKEGEKKQFYLNIRNDYNLTEFSSIKSAIYLFILNKLCFNGLYRENSKGNFNVPFGQKNSFPEILKEDFDNVSRLLAKTEIYNSDFETTLGKANSGDFVYLDPPYIPINKTSDFTSYSFAGFNIRDHERIASIMKDLESMGIKAICSNSDTELSRKVFSKLNIYTLTAQRMVSAKASGRGLISELVITNY
jgi:DNA adenine methylase